jgi:ribosomal protein S18 acetylase RimI-like enzyme
VTPTAWVAEPREAHSVAALLVEFRDFSGRDWPSENSFLATVERLLPGIDTEYLLASADADSPPVGVCQLRFRLSVWTAAEDCWMEDLFVSEPARRRGVGDALVALALERARERGCRRIELDASESNAAALALYERFGFTRHSKSAAPDRDLFLGVKLE